MSQHTLPARVKAPASKSLSHRALIAASLAAGETKLHNVLHSDDLERTAHCLRAAGAAIESLHAQEPGAFAVLGMAEGPQGGTAATPADIDVGESGTTCRLLTAVLAAGRGTFRVHGAGRMHERPIGALARTLQSLGVTFTYEGEPQRPPFLMSAEGLTPPPDGAALPVDMAESSQYLSGLLLAAPLAAGPLVFELAGEKAVSWPYVALTLQTLEDFGVPFTVETRPDPASDAWETADWTRLTPQTGAAPGLARFRMAPAVYQPRSLTVEGDWSNASYCIAAGAAGPALVTIDGLQRDSRQGDAAMLDIVTAMGAHVSWEGDALTVEPRRLIGVEVDMAACPDIAPTVAALAALAEGPTRITGVAHLRIKESDRLAAMASELAKVGAQVELLQDGMVITPQPIPLALKHTGAALSSHGDHRIAMSCSLFERAGLPVTFDDPSVVAKSFPEFWETWETLRHGGDLQAATDLRLDPETPGADE